MKSRRHDLRERICQGIAAPAQYRAHQLAVCLQPAVRERGPHDASGDMRWPATVSMFRLDKYEVTVGRFRAFVDAGMGTQSKPPVAGAKLLSVDESSVRNMPGFVKVVSKGNYVAVVCEREEQAIAAAKALKCNWQKPATPQLAARDSGYFLVYRYIAPDVQRRRLIIQ